MKHYAVRSIGISSMGRTTVIHTQEEKIIGALFVPEIKAEAAVSPSGQINMSIRTRIEVLVQYCGDGETVGATMNQHTNVIVCRQYSPYVGEDNLRIIGTGVVDGLGAVVYEEIKNL